MTEKVVTLPRAAHTKNSTMETVEVTLESVNAWLIPPFQRPLRINEKVRTIAGQIDADGGVIPGVITVGVLGREKRTYLIDGQHRLEAFRLSNCQTALADVRFMHFDTMADMAQEFVDLNSRIVNMRPDDVLRGLEESVEPLRMIRKDCPFVGYDMIRRGTSAPMVSMSAVIRIWAGSQQETPVAMSKSAATLATELTHDSAIQLRIFLTMVYEAWGRDESANRLWGNLNLALCMWLWRRLVIETERTKKRYVVLRNEQFKRCLMSLAANASYTDWLLGRGLSDRDRAPCYTRMKGIFVRRLLEDKVTKGGKVLMPSPAWARQ